MYITSALMVAYLAKWQTMSETKHQVNSQLRAFKVPGCGSHMVSVGVSVCCMNNLNIYTL